jgi:5-methyltetrahydropteroyltriglutamate--homocysteine methyltransferase
MVHVCYGYSKNIAEKRTTPVYAKALETLAASKVDDISLEYEQPGHSPDLLEHTGTKGIALGVLNLDTEAAVETADHIYGRASAAAEVIGTARLRLAPDCGMWFLPRDRAVAKIVAMEQAAQRLRSESSSA